MWSQQRRWYWALRYFNNKINLLYSSKIRFWSLRFHQFGVCQVNTAIGVPDRGAGGSRPPWIWETSKIRADGMGNSGIQGTEFF